MSDGEQQSSAVDEQKVIGQNQAKAPTADESEQVAALKDFNKTQGADQLSMRVKVYSPYKEYYDGQAFSVTAENATGTFDVLPKHHNFISLQRAKIDHVLQCS